MNKPRLLDLCCCAGGASVGYARAGFEVVGVDIEPQPRYPFTFYQADALDFPLDGFDAYHASPPCQRFSSTKNFSPGRGRNHPDLVAALRRRLVAQGKPYVLENVVGAPLRNPILLCGAMFGLRVYRHRLFESNVLLFQPSHLRHRAKAARPAKIPAPGQFWSICGKFGQQEDAQRAMGIDWMPTHVHHPVEIAQAIPPAYTVWVGLQLMEVLA